MSRPVTKKGILEYEYRNYVRDMENFHPQSEPVFPIVDLRRCFEEFEETHSKEAQTAYNLFLYLLKQKKP